MNSSVDATRPVLVSLQKVSKQFGATRALNDVSLGFSRGEIHCLLGENGAGKSTIGKLLGGIHEPDCGELRIDAVQVRLRSVAEARAHGIGLVFQELSLAPDLTVRENICLGTEPRRHPLTLLRRKAEEQRCQMLLREFGLDTDLSARVGDLPVASQQMIEIAKALALAPRVLVLDEPTAMLGAPEKQKLFRILRQLKSQGTTFIFITHHVDEVIEIGDRVSIMRDGALIESFAVEDGVDAEYIVERLTGKRSKRALPESRTVDTANMLSICNLRSRNGSTAEISAHRGEIVGLYGVMGCGRERVVHALVGLQKCSDLTFALDGTSYRPRTPAAAARQGVAYLPVGRASNCILPTRSIKENLMLTQLHKWQRGGVLTGAAERAAAREQLTRLHTRLACEDDAITSLSGGNQQKVVFGRCLGHASRLLVLEEPTAGIDIAAKQEIHDLIRERANHGLTVILMSSDLGETMALCDVVYTFFAGRVFGVYRQPIVASEGDIIADVLGNAEQQVQRHDNVSRVC